MTIPSADEDTEQLRLLLMVEMQNGTGILEKHLAVAYKVKYILIPYWLNSPTLDKLKTCVHIKTHTPVLIGSSCNKLAKY